MGTDTEMVALDSNAMTMLIKVLSAVTAPSPGPHFDKQMALAHTFFYLPSECCFHLTPTVEAEYLRIRDVSILNDHQSWASSLFCSVYPLPDTTSVELRAAELNKFHRGERNLDDCRVLAECELSMIKCLISDDTGFVKKLHFHSPTVKLCAPQEYWESLKISSESKPEREPHPSNPLFGMNWWRA